MWLAKFGGIIDVKVGKYPGLCAFLATERLFGIGGCGPPICAHDEAGSEVGYSLVVGSWVVSPSGKSLSSSAHLC
jgi:hypothetical protein